MRRVHCSAVALLLAVTTSAWAAVEPYPTAVQGEDVSTKTRAEVIAELREAHRLGLMANVESDFPNVSVGAGSAQTFDGGGPRLSRARVHAETVEAGRLGLLNVGEGVPPVATAEQEELIAAAGRRAAENTLAAQRVSRDAGK